MGWLLRADGGVVGVSSCWPGCSSHGIFTWRSGWGQFSYSKCFPNVALLPFVFLTFFAILCFIVERVLEALKAMLENSFSKTSFCLTEFFGFGGLGVRGFESLGGKQDRGAPNSGRPLLLMKFQVCL